MCNSCSCDNDDRCSVVGCVSLGFCCPKCELYTESLDCIRLKVRVTKVKPDVVAYLEVMNA
ncbi:MAG: hypothetical protein KGD73_07925 [Candidatus Lokiarchaeota archaeon]|nr:hypothetical protein [Candidatus Lokiarchaeota archaeon]